MGLFGFPLAFWALTALPTLGAIYWLRNRYKNATVSSLMLWEQFSVARQGGRKFQRIQTPLLFLIELLALAFLAIAATIPIFPASHAVRNLIVVLDDSWSMQAESAETTVKQKAIELIETEFNKHPKTNATIILAGRAVEQLADNITTVSQLDSYLKSYHAESDLADIDSALVLAKGLSRGWTDIIVVTDHAPDRDIPQNGNLCWHAIGSKQPNIALVNAFRSVTPDAQQLVVELSNLSPASSTTTVNVTVEPSPADPDETKPIIVIQKSYTLEPALTKRLTFNLPNTTKPVRVALTSQTDQAISIDDSALLLAPDITPLRVAVNTSDEPTRKYITNAINSTGLCEYNNTSPELLVTDKTEYLGRTPGPWRLSIQNEPDATSYTAPYISDYTNDLLEGTSFEGSIWAAEKPKVPEDPTAPLPPALSGQPILLVGTVPLINLFARSDDRFDLLMRCNPERSTIQNTINFPVLITNLVNTVLRDRVGPERVNVTVGQEIKLSLPDKALSILQTFPRKSPQLISLTGIDSRSYTLVPHTPGLYQFQVNLPANQSPVQFSVAVNALNRRESNLANCTMKELGSFAPNQQASTSYQKLSWVLVLFALSLLIVHMVIIRKAGAAA